MKIDFVRESAIKILNEIETKNAYSNIVLDEYIRKNKQKLNDKDIGFLSELVYGTTMWKMTLDKVIEMHSNIKLKKISKWIQNILRIGIYQIIFLDKVPVSAAVNECVNLTKKYSAKSVGFVNAVLRKVEKEDYQRIFEIKEKEKQIAFAFSMPIWIVEELMKDYPIETVEEICRQSTLRPKMTIRVNSLKTTKEELMKKLKERGIEYKETKMQDFLQIQIKNIADLDLFLEGYFTVQDMSAGLASFVLSPKQGEALLDACSAPGGKTTYLAELMENKGKIIAWDIYEHRLELVKQKAKQLGIDIIHVEKQDATKYKEEYEGNFDKILLDVPCMGLGVIKRKPDIKWQRKQEDTKEINQIQKEILDTCSKYLKRGGELVYSTCSILKEENQNVIQEFLKENDSFEIVQNKEGEKMEKLILPNEEQDGFYICKLVKK